MFKFKYLVVILLIPVIVFVAWMNLTPGHFQFYKCSCIIAYLNQQQINVFKENEKKLGYDICNVVGVCAINTKDILLNLLLAFSSNFDLNK